MPLLFYNPVPTKFSTPLVTSPPPPNAKGLPPCQLQLQELRSLVSTPELPPRVAGKTSMLPSAPPSNCSAAGLENSGGRGRPEPVAPGMLKPCLQGGHSLGELALHEANLLWH